ncbi:MAG: hypothetical protein SPI86_05150 [Treponemataceae bacterium]|nr:hypothetical protein [Spirochaetales bacterium]MDY6031132.1 hypothetical protein [Treponemataceae bacterium]
MTRGKNGRPDRKMKPIILVLCEGETEESYVENLKQKYRLPIKIVSKNEFIAVLEKNNESK